MARVQLTLIKNGAEYPICCERGNHYYYENLSRFKRESEPFEKCPEDCPNHTEEV